LPINTIAGPSTSASQAGWGGTASYVGPNLVMPSRVYLGKTFSVTANYQNEGLTIETNPLSSDPLNGIVIKQTSATSFDVTVNDGKFITKNSPEAKLYVRAKSNYTPKKGEAREIIRNIQKMRKEQNLTLKDKIEIDLPSWPEEFEEMILRLTNAVKLNKNEIVEIKLV
jgi:hypothetical protein